MQISPKLTRDLVSDEITRTSLVADEATRLQIEKLKACRVDLTKEFPPEQNVLYYDNVPFLRKGNISIIQGKPKAGKSFLCSMITSAALCGQYEGLTAYGCKGVPLVLYFDTEQCEEDAIALAKRILRMAKLPTNEFPQNFALYSLRKYAPTDARNMVEAAIATYKPALVIVDGITDLVDQPNDEKESKERVAWLNSLAEDNNTHVLTVIHENPNFSNKARGHIGSELERKLETAVKLEVTQEERYRVKRVDFKLTRKKSPDNFQFEIDSDGFPHIEPWTEPSKIVASKPQPDEPVVSQEDKIQDRLRSAYNGKHVGLSKSELAAALKKHANVSDATARRDISYGVDKGYLLQVEDKFYLADSVSQNLPFAPPSSQEKLPF